MNRRWLVPAGLAAAAVLVVAVVVAVVRGGSDETTATTQTTVATSKPVASTLAPPSLGSRPAPSSPAEQRSTDATVLAFWTPARIRAALNHPGAQGPSPASGQPKAAVPPGAGRTAKTESTLRPGESTEEKAATVRCAQPKLRRASAGYGYTRTCYRGKITAPPARMMGQLFYELPPKYDEWVCSATVAGTGNAETPGNSSVLVTAGHCMGVPAHGAPHHESNGNWQPVRNLIFIPTPVLYAWDRKSFPNEKASQRWLNAHAWLPRWYSGTHNPVGFITTSWHDTWSFPGDFAAIVMATRKIGGRNVAIGNQLGGLGVSMNGAAANRTVEPLGFPAGEPFKGYRLFECHGTSSLAEDGELGVGCDMTGGSSGGPWLADTNGDGSKEIVSVNSNGPPNVMFGPDLNVRDHWSVFDSARKT